MTLDSPSIVRPNEALQVSRDHCRELSKAQAKNFYWGMKLVPEPKRSAMYALYAWMRRVDDLADEAGDVDAKRAALMAFQHRTDQVMSSAVSEQHYPDGDLIWPAFCDAARTYGLQTQDLHDMIAGQLADLEPVRFTRFEDLYVYCYKVASVVGLCCVRIWGHDDHPDLRQLSEWRGIAFQLTNILRDVLEDAQRGRVYLPAEDFDVYEINPAMFTLGKPADLLPGLKKVAERARQYYEDSAPLDQLVHPDGRACLWAMTRIYRGLLEKILENPVRVLSGERVSLSKLRKVSIALQASWRSPRG